VNDWRDPAYRARLHQEIDRKLDEEERKFYHATD
jgi:hypothetical protein